MGSAPPAFVIAFILVALVVLVLNIVSYRRNRSTVSLVLAFCVLGVAIWFVLIFYGKETINLVVNVFPAFGFGLAGILFGLPLSRRRLFDFSPPAHKVILGSIGEGYLVFDARDKVVEINRQACQFLTLDVSEVVGLPITSVLERWPALLEWIQQGGQAPVELKTAATPPQYLEANITDWYKNGPRKAGRILMLHDITRLKIAEESLRQSERLYRLVVNSMPVGITLTDEQGKINFASPKMLEICHIEGNTDITGQSILDWLHPDEKARGIQRMAKAIDEKESLPSQEYKFQREDGSVFWGEVTSTPVIDDQGILKGQLTVVRDVSQRVALEGRLEHHLEQETFINSLLQTLYRPHDKLAALSQVIEQAGLFTKASRVYLCKDTADGTENHIVLEWCRAGIKTRAHETALFRYKETPTWRECLEENGMVLIPEKGSAPPDIAEYMTAWNILSMAVFPIYGTEERVYGFLGFDYTEEAHGWAEDDMELLWNVCRIVSGVVAQRQVEEAEHRQRVLAEVLHDTASALNSTLNFEEVLDRILANLDQIVKHEAASIALVNEDNMVNFVRWRGYDSSGEELMHSLSIAVSDRDTYRIMSETGSPVIIPDTWSDPRWTRTPEYSWIRSYAGMPIQIKGRIAGFINLDSHEPDYFTHDLAYSLHVFADQAAVAIENARLYAAARRRAEEMSTLNRIGLTVTMTAGLEMDRLLLSLFELCREVLPIDAFFVALYDSESGRIDYPFYFQAGRFEQVIPRNINQNPGATGMVIRQRKTISLPDILDPEIDRKLQTGRLGGQTTRSYVGVPLILLDQVIGVISMQSFQPRAYSEDQVRLLETIAIQATIAIQNARLYDQMKQMAITDAVTKLYTRRHFSSLGRNEMERTLRYNRKLSVLMVDIDRFKRVNDTYGHTAGDQVLLSVANTCRQALRVTDILGRWGGEEFVIILPEADREGAALIGERIRRMVSETDIPLAQEKIHVTISVGVAAISDKSQTLEALIDSADHAMYAAKQSGRNQVRIADNDAPGKTA